VRFEDWGYLERMESEVGRGLLAINQACTAAAVPDGGPPWVALTAPYANATLAYAKTYRRLSETRLDSPGAIAALSTYWSAARGALEANSNLSYGTNQAVELFRIANLILVNKAQASTGQSLDLGSLQQSVRDQLATSPARPLSNDVQELGGTNAQQVIAAWQRAVAVEDSLYYDEPRNWYYTLRESLGYAYLAQGQYENAERTFVEDLANNRLSGRSLYGLRLSLEQQPGKTVPPLLEQQFANAWRNATVSPAP